MTTHVYRTHFYDEAGTLTIKSERDLTIVASPDEELVLITDSNNAVVIPSSDPVNTAVLLANIIFNTNKETTK